MQRNLKGPIVGLSLVTVLSSAAVFGGSNGPASAAPSQPGEVWAVRGDGTLAEGRIAESIGPLEGGFRYLPGPFFESTIASGNDGTLYAMSTRWDAGRGGTFGNWPGYTRVLTSEDGGVSWADKTPRLPNGASAAITFADPIVTTDPLSDRVFHMSFHAGYSYSDDGGTSWVPSQIYMNEDRPWIVTGRARSLTPVNYPGLVYFCAGANPLPAASCRTSLDGGISFGPPSFISEFGDVFGTLNEPPDGCLPNIGQPVTDLEGRMFVPHAHCDGRILVAVSEDDAQTWSVSTVDSSAGALWTDCCLRFPEIATDSKGNVYVMWIAADGLPRLSVSVDHGATWDAPRLLSPPNVTATDFPALVAGAEGRVAVAYLGTNWPGGYKGTGGLPWRRGGRQEHEDWAGAEWHGYIGVLMKATHAKAPTFTTLFNPQKDPLARGYCGHSMCDDNLGQPRGLQDFIDMTLDPSGRPWVVAGDLCHEICNSQTGLNDYNLGIVGTLLKGPSLLKGERPLAELMTAADFPATSVLGILTSRCWRNCTSSARPPGAD